MTWVDSHCHPQLAEASAQELIDRAVEVDWMVVPGVDVATSEAALDLAERNPLRVVAAVGLHPNEASKWEVEARRIEELAQKAVAVGEIGLDFYRDHTPRERQIPVFAAQLQLAKRLNKPAIIHCRDAFSEVHRLVEESELGPLAVMHCWTGGPKWTRRFLDLGVTFGFAGPIAFETGDTIRRAAAEVPIDRGMVETDTPYLSPPPYRDLENEPSRVSLVGAALAEVWDITVEETAAATSENATRVFGGPK